MNIWPCLILPWVLVIERRDSDLLMLYIERVLIMVMHLIKTDRSNAFRLFDSSSYVYSIRWSIDRKRSSGALKHVELNLLTDAVQKWSTLALVSTQW